MEQPRRRYNTITCINKDQCFDMLNLIVQLHSCHRNADFFIVHIALKKLNNKMNIQSYILNCFVHF